MLNDAELDEFIDESIRISIAKGYTPTTFLEMRHRWGTKGAISRLIEKSDIQSGFKKALALGIMEWTLEAAVLKFPCLFSKQIQEAAQFRLNMAKTGKI